MPPGSVLLTLIDEITLYETQRLQYETSLVMEKLVQLAAEEGNLQVFKLLVTCHDRALGISRFFLGHTVDLQEEIEVDDSAEWVISTLGK